MVALRAVGFAAEQDRAWNGIAWWEEIDSSVEWQRGLFYALCAAYALVSLVALVIIIITLLIDHLSSLHAMKPGKIWQFHEKNFGFFFLSRFTSDLVAGPVDPLNWVLFLVKQP